MEMQARMADQVYAKHIKTPLLYGLDVCHQSREVVYRPFNQYDHGLRIPSRDLQ
jgi:hypothetical protein